MSRARIALLTLLALVAFAGNSLLCRAALAQTGIDAASFVAGAQNAMMGVAALAGVLLLRLGAQPWKQMEEG